MNPNMVSHLDVVEYSEYISHMRFLNRTRGPGEPPHQILTLQQLADKTRGFPPALPAEHSSLDSDDNDEDVGILPNQTTDLSLQLARYFNNSKFSDVLLNVGAYSFHAHKLVLCTWSKVFKEMFMMKTKCDEVAGFEECTLAESEEMANVFGDFLKFMYTETLELNDNNLYPIYELAKKYEVQGLSDVCQEFLAQKVVFDKTAALMTLSKAEECGMTELYKHCFRVLETIFEFLEESCILEMSPGLFMKLLRSSNLVVSFELRVLLLAFRWLTVEGKERRKYTEEIISLIRFPFISPVAFKTIVCKLLTCPKMYPSFKRLLQERIQRVYEWKLLASDTEFRKLPYHMQFAAFARNYMVIRYYISEPEANYKRLTLLDKKERSKRGKSNEVTKTILFVPSVSVIGVTANNLFKAEDNDWLVAGVAFYDKSCERWGIRYHVQPSPAAHARHKQRIYRLVILTILPGSNWRHPEVHISTGTVPTVGSGKTMTVRLPPRLMGLKKKPAYVKVRANLFIKVTRGQMLNVKLLTPTELLRQKTFSLNAWDRKLQVCSEAEKY